MTFDPGGLRCEIVLPLESAAAEQEPQGIDWSV